ARRERRGGGTVISATAKGRCTRRQGGILRRSSVGISCIGFTTTSDGRAMDARRAGERFAQCLGHVAMDGAAVAEAYFMLGGVNVYVHRTRIHRQEKDIGRMPIAMQYVGISLPHGVGNVAITYEAPVDVQVLAVRAMACQRGPADQTLQGNQPLLALHQYPLFRTHASLHIAQAL